MSKIPRLAFGRSGHLSSRTLFGAAALGDVSQREADRTIELLLEYGVNHIDTAASYGQSEPRLAPALEKHREDFFLATKTGERGYERAKAQLEASRQRLGVDTLDLIQLHCLVEEHEWEQAMGDEGALRALVEARNAGAVRFIGVTGHGLSAPRMHLRSLERFDFDSVLLPYSFTMLQNPDYAADVAALLEVCEARNVAVQTIKAITRRPYIEGEQRPYSTWYLPLESDAAIERAVHWVLSRPRLFLNTVGDTRLLPKVLEAAARFREAPQDDALVSDARELQMSPLFL